MRIPKLIHRIWLGQRPIPDDFLVYGLSWQTHHPGWSQILWTESMLEHLPMINPALYKRYECWYERADYLRYEILYHFGGVYVDTDFECLKPLDSLLEETSAFGAYYIDDQKINNAIMGCERYNACFLSLLHEAPAYFEAYPEDSQEKIGPHFLTRQMLGDSAFTKFPAAYFYPYLWTETPKPKEAYKDAYALHHWAGSWLL